MGLASRKSVRKAEVEVEQAGTLRLISINRHSDSTLFTDVDGFGGCEGVPDEHPAGCKQRGGVVASPDEFIDE